MVVAIGFLLALVCIGVAAFPFLKYRRARQIVDPTAVIEGLEKQRWLIYREMMTLEDSCRAGSVPEAEFSAVSQTLRRRAAENLWLQHQWEEKLADLDKALEAIISQASAAAEGEVADSRPSTTPCSECGAGVAFDAKACMNCGAERENGRPVYGGRSTD